MVDMMVMLILMLIVSSARALENNVHSERTVSIRDNSGLALLNGSPCRRLR